jgi:hypothetical protein
VRMVSSPAFGDHNAASSPKARARGLAFAERKARSIRATKTFSFLTFVIGLRLS